ncbi:MAG TPA: hypothetical protein VKI44_09280 [Acetobacteraceae bacterium]|nr:hypothetical protein [Acetobacteraceae bacterium]
MSHIDLLPQLPPSIARHTMFLLLESLPPPLSDTQEERAARDEAAIASLAVLHPADAFEARLAARAVAADARATECLRLASVPKMPPDRVDQCLRQANAMMRASAAALRSLQTMQAAREKAEQAVQQTTPAAAEPPARDTEAEAEQYARRNPQDAARIRRLGRLPEGHAPMPPALVQAIATGTSPALRALDSADGKEMPRAA